MTPHPHAENMRLYAEDAAETDKPWERWEFSSIGGGWNDIQGAHPSWRPSINYRRKPRTIRIGEFDVPEPVREPLGHGLSYWVCGTGDRHERASEYCWGSDHMDFLWLKRGMIHLTREAAELHAKALLSFTAKGGKEDA